MAKSFEISKKFIWQAYLEVKSKKGAPGVDRESIEDFENNLKNNLYKLWNRLSSGSYFPPPVKAVSIPKKNGGTRILGIPTITDRIAQTVVKMVIEPILEPIFDKDSYGYRPCKSAHEAIAATRKRCWNYDWVVEFDIKGLFDNINHKLLMKALRYHCNCKWVLLYIERWLKAPLQENNGILTLRKKGTPQGGVVSPVLSNLFLHYTFDAWVRRSLPSIPFCRYADDGLLHCNNKQQAEFILKRITERFLECGLEINQQKSSIVYCKDRNRREEYCNIKFDFLGYTFRPRRCVDKQGNVHPNFLPAISQVSMKAINRRMRSWHIQLKNEKSLFDLSKIFNPILRGWYGYYGKFYPSMMERLWRNFNNYLIRWVRRKFKSFARHKIRASKYLRHIAKTNSMLFIHWKCGYSP
ncbi:group II intron reverse transcriptase/maturase [Candidatus Uabimicrobium sp. HlEnr_7]|uniref:group II intron reverse transcriptase/maturase n=1 Tax=Candidatus Uabimicrobium helgolandensis TaxID=3095367 RepID=UPI0035591233